MNHFNDCQGDQCLLGMMTSTEASARQQGWQAWYERDSEILHCYIRRRCQASGCVEHSEDILQDAFMIAFKNISSGRYQACGKPLCAYLSGIAHNLIHEVVRLQHKELCSEEHLEAQAEEAISPDDRVYVEEISLLVMEAYQQLSMVCRQVVEGLYAHEKTSQELSSELRKSANNIRAIAHRAIHAIGKYLAEHYHLQLSSEAIRLCLKMLY